MDPFRLPEILRSIYDAVDALEAMFPGRHFTPDGHMVGSLGEALAAHHYGITLSPASSPRHDGSCNGWMVQVKATQGNRVALSSEPEHLLVLKSNRDGSFSECYNGPGSFVWDRVSQKDRPKNGQYQVTLSTLQTLMLEVSAEFRLVRQLPDQTTGETLKDVPEEDDRANSKDRC